MTRGMMVLVALSQVIPTLLFAAPAEKPPPRALGADFNGDGQPDLVWRNHRTGENEVWFMEGATLLSKAPLPAQPDLNWHLAAVADFDGDGKPDLVWRNYQTGENVAWLMDGTRRVSTVQLPAVADSHWALSGAADFNGDGQVDLLWRNYHSGETQLWLMKGAAIAKTVALKTVADTRWTIEAVADVNGDGKPDVLWRNFWTGKNGVWLMDGTTIVTDTDRLPAVQDPNWRLTGNPFSGADGKLGLVFRNYHTGQNRAWFLDWQEGQAKLVTERTLPSRPDPDWQVVDPVGCQADTLLSDEEAHAYALEQTTLGVGGGGYNAYDAAGVSSLYTMSGRLVLRYPRRASTSKVFQFKKLELEKQVAAYRRAMQVQLAMAHGYTATDPETGRPALFTASRVKVFVFSDDTWP